MGRNGEKVKRKDGRGGGREGREGRGKKEDGKGKQLTRDSLHLHQESHRGQRGPGPASCCFTLSGCDSWEDLTSRIGASSHCYNVLREIVQVTPTHLGFKKKKKCWTGEIAKLRKVLVAKPDDLSSRPRIQMVDGEN